MQHNIERRFIELLCGYKPDYSSYEEAVSAIDFIFSLSKEDVKKSVLTRMVRIALSHDAQTEQRLYAQLNCAWHSCEVVALRKDMYRVNSDVYCETCAKKHYSYSCVACSKFCIKSDSRQAGVFCDNCSIKYGPEIKRISGANTRARAIGRIANLSIEGWFRTLKFFNFSCAYCGGSYDVVEHFIPLSRGGHSTNLNCFPSCWKCNSTKSDWHPLKDDGMPKVDMSRLQRVMMYIEQAS